MAIFKVIDLTRAVRQRFGDYMFTVTAPEPFESELITPVSLEGSSEQQTVIM